MKTTLITLQDGFLFVRYKLILKEMSLFEETGVVSQR